MTAVRKRPELRDERSDDALLAAVHAGDRAALAVLYDRHAQAVYGYARRFVRGADAEDVVQTTFLRLSTIAGNFDGRSTSARAWIFGVTFGVLRERRRAVGRFGEALLRYAQAAFARTAEPTIGTVDLERALAELSEPMRTVVVLTRLYGFTCDEVARMLDVPVGTVWTRLHYAKKELSARLEMTR